MLTKQDIYLLFTDMTEAFDTISHRKLLMILYDLGFPPDAIETVKDLHTNARTVIQTPHGPLDPFDFGRGTIQGDSLSPFLFILVRPDCGCCPIGSLRLCTELCIELCIDAGALDGG
jgi:hypothetical protein